MKRFALALTFILFALTAHADTYVHGYTKRDGTTVAPYFRSDRDSTVQNNYSFEGNTNPYTGAIGTNQYKHDITSPYYEGPDAQGHIGHEDAEPSDNSGDE